MLTKFLDPKNDFAFKKVFGTEKNKDILIHFYEGMEKGIEKGREEKTIEIAKNMLNKGLDRETISTLTGLPLEDIKTLI